MKIDSIEAIPVVLEAMPFATSYGPISQYRNVIVRVRADEWEGWGEAPPAYPRETGETQGTIMDIISTCLRPTLLGEDPREIGRLHWLMNRSVRGHYIAKAAIDIALYDLVGKKLSVSVGTLLGGCFRSTFKTVGCVGIDEPERMASNALDQVEQGYQALKVKLPGVMNEDPTRSVERIKLIRGHIGENTVLIVDLNQGWINPSIALRGIRRIEHDNNVYLEQPILAGDYDGLKKIAENTSMPIIADESASTEEGLVEIIRRGSPRLVNIKTTRPGGLYEAMKLVNLAIAGGIHCQIDDAVETKIASTASAYLASSVPEEFFFAYSGGVAHSWLKDDILAAGGIHLEGGTVTLPTDPGLGIQINQEALRTFTVGRDK